MKFIRHILVLIVLTSTTLLSGTSALAYPQIIVSPGYLDFGQVDIDLSSMNSVTIQNMGQEDIPFVNVFTMGDMTSFDVMGSCGYLPRYSSCMIEVQFNPRSEGMHSAELQIQAGVASEYVQMSGMGVKRPE